MLYEKHDVAITRYIRRTETKAVLEGLDLIEARRVINEEDIVLLIPNWVNDIKKKPKEGVVVGDNTFESIIKWLKDQNPTKIIVGTGSAHGDTEKVMREVGYDKILREEDIEFVDFNKGPYEELKLKGATPKKININSIILEATKIISFTQLKMHEEATMSASIKNMALGIPSTEEHGTPKKELGIHDNLHEFISSMAKEIRIDISIVSANPVMVGTGPTNGVSIHTGLVICGLDPISTDTICARLLGFKPQAIRYLYNLEKDEIGETNISLIPKRGLELELAENHFSKKVYGKKMSLDKK